MTAADLVRLYDAGGFWFVALVVELLVACGLLVIIAGSIVAAGAWTWLQANLGDQ